MKKLPECKSKFKYTVFLGWVIGLFFCGIITIDAAEIFNNFNIGAVTQSASGPINPSVFTVSNPVKITTIYTYHWNDGAGDEQGQISIQDINGNIIGSWEATGWPGEPEYAYYWYSFVYPNMILQPGAYTVKDTHYYTWSFNDESNNSGFTYVEGDIIPEPVLPAVKDDCKNSKWSTYHSLTGDMIFKNQGDCIQYVNTGR